jgi:hypothetical protein
MWAAHTPPTILVDEAEPLLEAIAIQSVAGISYVEQDIIEECLEGRNRGSSLNQ